MNVKKESAIKISCLGLVACLIVSSATGCSSGKSASASDTAAALKVKSVNTVTTAIEAHTEYLDYKGFVTAKDEKRLAFVQSGTVKYVYVEEGQRVKSGELLAELDTEYINIALSNAEQNVRLAQNGITQINDSENKIILGIEAEQINLIKAQSAVEVDEINIQKTVDSYESALATLRLKYNDTKNNSDKLKILYEAGAVAESTYNDAVIGLETLEQELRKTELAYKNDLELLNKSLENSKNTIEQQKINIASLQNEVNSLGTQRENAGLQREQAVIGTKQYVQQLGDTKLTSPIDGIVLSVIAQEGQISGAGSTAVIIKSEEQVIKIGVSIDDVPEIKMGMDAEIELSGAPVHGKVSQIAQYPDEGTRTYTVEISPDTGNLTLGAIAGVKIPLETKNAVFIPISAVTTNGASYIYAVEEKGNGEYIAVRKEVVLGEVDGSRVEAQNIAPSVIIVADNVKNIKENDNLVVSE